MIYLLITVALAFFTQSLTGFGSGLISMAILPGILGIQFAVPLVALMSMSLELFLLFRFRNAFCFQEIWFIGLAAVIAIPGGVWLLRRLDEGMLIMILGVIIVCYSTYALLNLRLPELKHPGWGILTGLLAGLLGGAYSIAGPPVIIYASCRKWQPDKFRGNLQWIFIIVDVFSVANHWLAGNITSSVLKNFLWIIPVIFFSLLAGSYVERFINPKLFRKIVLVLLLAMGIRWIVSVL